MLLTTLSELAGFHIAKFFHPHRSIGYKATYSARRNVEIGREKGLSYLTIAKELNALANVQHRSNPKAARSFRKAASLAFKMYDERRR